MKDKINLDSLILSEVMSIFLVFNSFINGKVSQLLIIKLLVETFSFDVL